MGNKALFLLCFSLVTLGPSAQASGTAPEQRSAAPAAKVTLLVGGKPVGQYPDLDQAFASITDGQQAVVQLQASIDLADLAVKAAPAGANCDVTLDLNGFTLAGGNATGLLVNETQAYDLKIVGPGTLFNYGNGCVVSDRTHSTLEVSGPLLLHGGQGNAVVSLPGGFVTVGNGARLISCNDNVDNDRSGVVRATLVTVDGGTVANCGDGDIINGTDDGEVMVRGGRILGKGKIASHTIYCLSDSVVRLKSPAWYAIRTVVADYDCRVQVDDQVTVNNGLLYGKSGKPIVLTLIPKAAGAAAPQVHVKAADASQPQLQRVAVASGAPAGAVSYTFEMPEAAVVIQEGAAQP